MVQVATKTALAESGNLFDSQNCTWGTFGNILCCVTCHKPPVATTPCSDDCVRVLVFHDRQINGSIDSPLEPQPAPSLHQDSSSRVRIETRWRATKPRATTKAKAL